LTPQNVIVSKTVKLSGKLFETLEELSASFQENWVVWKLFQEFVSLSTDRFMEYLELLNDSSKREVSEGVVMIEGTADSDEKFIEAACDVVIDPSVLFGYVIVEAGRRDVAWASERLVD